MNYENVNNVIQIGGTDIHPTTRKVNAYLKYGWRILAILQLGDSADGAWSCPVFVLGHVNPKAEEPTQDPYSKAWS